MYREAGVEVGLYDHIICYERQCSQFSGGRKCVCYMWGKISSLKQSASY